MIGQPRERSSSLTFWLLACGVVGCVQFVAVWLIEGAVRPGYDPVRDAVSLLSLTDAGIVDVVSLVLAGLLLIAMAIGVRRAWLPADRLFWGPLLLGVAGLGFISAGVFFTDPAQGYPPGTPNGPAVTSTFHGTLHFALGVPGVFGGLTATALIFSRRFWRQRGRALAVYSIISAVATAGGLVGFAAVVSRDGPGGLFERLSFAVGLSWVVVLATVSATRARNPHRLAGRG